MNPFKIFIADDLDHEFFLAVKMFIKYSEDKVHKLWIQYILDGSESGFFKKERMNLFKKIYLIEFFVFLLRYYFQVLLKKGKIIYTRDLQDHPTVELQ